MIVVLTFILSLMLAWYMPMGVNQVAGAPQDIPGLATVTQQLGEFPVAHDDIRQAQSRVDQLQRVDRPATEAFATLIETRPMSTTPLAVPQTVEPASQVTAVTPTQQQSQRDYALSMIFVGPEARYAVIDGLFRQEGDRMPDGAKIFAIREQSVELRNSDAIQVLRINR